MARHGVTNVLASRIRVIKSGVCGRSMNKCARPLVPPRTARSAVATVWAWVTAIRPASCAAATLSAQLRTYGMSTQDAADRTAAVEALMMGTVIAQRMLPPGSPGQKSTEQLRDWLAAALQSLLDHPPVQP